MREDKTASQCTRVMGIKIKRKPRLCKRCGALSPTTATLAQVEDELSPKLR
jgi:ribosomal protein S27AE